MTMNSNTSSNKINWKEYPIEVEHGDYLLKGTIVYWAKDFKVILEEPCHAESNYLHMMYMIPARFVTPQDTDTLSNVKDIDIVIQCKTKLVKLFDESP